MGTKQTPDFIDGEIAESNRVNAQWLNGVNTAVYEAIGNGSTNPTTGAQVRTNIAAAKSGNNDDITSMQLFTAYGIDMAADSSINGSISTLASSTTPDIWTDQSNTIYYTGAVTATGFASAPQAGARRMLVLQTIAAFTAGPTLIIPGVPSGISFTGQANVQIEVLALTVSTFLLNIKGPTTGTWTPVLQGTGGGPLTHSAQVGNWSFRDGIVEIWGTVVISGGVGITGAASIVGLPIASNATASDYTAFSVGDFGIITLPTNYTTLGCLLAPSSTALALTMSGSTVVPNTVDGSLIGAGFTFVFYGRYRI